MLLTSHSRFRRPGFPLPDRWKLKSLPIAKNTIGIIAVAAYVLFTLFAECAAAKICGFHGTLFNPFIQAAWLYLALFGVTIVPGGNITRVLLSLLIPVLSLVAASGAALYLKFGIPMNGDVYFVICSSSPREIREFLGTFADWKIAVTTVLFSASSVAVLRTIWKTSFKRSVFSIAAGLLLICPYLINVCRYAAAKEYRRLCDRSNLPRLAVGYSSYRDAMKQLYRMSRKPRLPSRIRRSDGNGDLLGIIVIGESANRNHWGCYGYCRNTTPQISRHSRDCIIFGDVIAPYAQTAVALPYILTSATIVPKRDAEYTIIDVLKSAGYRTVLISNQYRWGKHDGTMGVVMSHCDDRKYLQDRSRGHLDMDTIPELTGEVNSSSGRPAVIILHLMGSHVAYRDRYPADCAPFHDRKDSRTAALSRENAAELNHYDNSIYYTDMVLGRIIDILNTQTRPAFMLYFPDHSDIGEWSGYRFPRSGASVVPDVYEIPFVFFTNTAYRKKYPRLVRAAENNADLPLQTDKAKWAILSAAQITFEHFPCGEDIFSPCYRPPKIRVMGLGKKEYRRVAPLRRKTRE